jgi:hypothetical protein
MKTLWPKSFLEWRDGDDLCISVPFTFDLPAVRTRVTQLTFDKPKRIRVGGPAVKLMPSYLADLPMEIGGDYPGVLQRFVPTATRTTTGCLRKCPFCAVPKVEGDFMELADWPDGNVVCDNNILRASQAHFDRVCDRLAKWGECDFNQGLDCRLLTHYHAERLYRINAVCRLALDNPKTMAAWDFAFERLRKAGVTKKNIMSYALVGFDSDPSEAWTRCKWIEAHGVKALPMWFHALDTLNKNAVTQKQAGLGWNDKERTEIMGYFYKHRQAARAIA